MSSVAKEANCEAFTVRIEGFEDLPAVKGQGRVDSPEFTCFGHQWKVQVYPGGNTNSDDGKIAVYLRHCSPVSIEVQATFVVAGRRGKCVAYCPLDVTKYEAVGEDEDNWGTGNFAKRSILIGALQDGALVIELLMKQTGHSSSFTPFVLENPSGRNTLKKFMSEETADVMFEVSKEQVKDGRETRKRAKTSPTTFYAHRFVLPESGALAEACESSSDLTPIPITGVEPSVFRHLLFYLYGGKVDGEVLKESAKEIIDAADKFGVVGLKLEAEASLVSATTFTMDNALDNLLYADAKNCALLKESVVDFMVENVDESIKRLTFDDIPSYLLKDFMTAVARPLLQRSTL